MSRKLLLTVPVILTTWLASQWMLSSELLVRKPFVYRVLLVWLARIPAMLGMPYGLAIRIGFVISAVLAVAAMHRLVRLWSWRSSILIWGACVCMIELALLLFFWEMKPYDFLTLMFFCLLLYYIAIEQWDWFLLTFALSCFNRETTLLLLPVSLWYAYRKGMAWKYMLVLGTSQVLLWFSIQFSLHAMFQSAAEQAMWWRPMQNLQLYWQHPVLAILQWGLLLGIIIWSFYQWPHTPVVLQQALLAMAPIMLVAYGLIGWSFEIRFFIELYAVIAPIVLLTIEYRFPFRKSHGKATYNPT